MIVKLVVSGVKLDLKEAKMEISKIFLFECLNKDKYELLLKYFVQCVICCLMSIKNRVAYYPH